MYVWLISHQHRYPLLCALLWPVHDLLNLIMMAPYMVKMHREKRECYHKRGRRR